MRLDELALWPSVEPPPKRNAELVRFMVCALSLRWLFDRDRVEAGTMDAKITSTTAWAASATSACGSTDRLRTTFQMHWYTERWLARPTGTGCEAIGVVGKTPA